MGSRRQHPDNALRRRAGARSAAGGSHVTARGQGRRPDPVRRGPLRAVEVEGPQTFAYNAAIQKTVTEQTQKVLDTLCGNRMADMQNQLQLQQALCGVVRYPQTFAYNAGPSPFCGCNPCCTGNI